MAAPFTPNDIIALAVDAERGTAPELIIGSFKRLVQEYAFQSAHCDPDERLSVAAEHAGYLTTRSGSWTVYVPWPLAFAFPSAITLDGLVSVAERSMLEGRGNVVLSGSTTFAGRVAALGDVDLAQYIFDDGSEIANRVERLMRRDGPTILVRVKFDREYQAPWEDLITALGRLRSLATESERIKLDFVDGVTPFGVMPVSNVVLPSDPSDRSKGAASRSFVFQEAVLTADGNPPWPLVVPEELLRYLKFLLRDMLAHRQAGKLVKALKRALSLTRILGLAELGDRAEAVLASRSAAGLAQESCMAELEALWPYLNADQQARLDASLKEKKGLAASIVESKGLPTQCSSLIDELMEKVKQFLAHEGVSFASWADGGS
ncbi:MULTISPECIES: hypothetical protein [unclassified Bradyrhizobium]|uniref:hypothetical protein n=1 Tax=unclassified Bradyrhizobium TaxID=2631580 RepID=UPI0028E371EC|nr:MULTISPECIES: hypothetical protein [unclassified Bradyrhizobium]